MSSKNQLFIVIGEIKRCRWTYWNDQPEGPIRPGCVVVVRPCNGDNEFEVHRGSGVWNAPVLASREGGLPRDKVVAITGQEFDILMGVPCVDDKERREMYSSSRLKWACQLKVGDAVLVKRKRILVPGVISGTGTHEIYTREYGLQFVVEITVNPSCNLIILITLHVIITVGGCIWTIIW